MIATINLPGIGGSGERHWQTLWEKTTPHMVRFRPTSWDNPDLEDWMSALDREVAKSPEAPVLIAHSLACLLVIHWAARKRHLVRGAFLVSVPDWALPGFPKEAMSFAHPPDAPLPFPALIVASRNDSYGSLDFMRERARCWRAGFVEAGALGHINKLSELGVWRQGADLLEAFVAGTGANILRTEDREH